MGIPKKRAQETAKNEALTTLLVKLSQDIGGAIDKAQGVLLYEIAVKVPGQTFLEPHRDTLVAYIRDSKLKTTKQLDAAFGFLKKGGAMASAEFDKAAGVGVSVTEAQIAAAVTAAIDANKAKIVADRYRFNTGILLGRILGEHPWADGKVAKDVIDAQLTALLGEKTAADLAKPEKKKKVKMPKEPKAKANAAVKEQTGAALRLHKVGENDKTALYQITDRTAFHLAEHVKRIHGQVRTRFPPEPNGVLHIGHAKAICFNFGYAEENNGITFLRYDDTNPEKEEERFFTGIRENVEWLGFKPHKITHSSDYFQELYDLAIGLIKTDQAYVCHQQASELKGHETRVDSPWRNRPIEESLALFEDMKNGKIDEGKASLRLKHTMSDGKLDPVAYRIKFCEHHRSKDGWCIYPTYDYTHCLCDSFEDITHSLCTKEFEGRRPSYYWLCNAVDIYCPVQWEYSRLNMSYTVVSKRKIGKLIDQGIVADWDDPRLFTLSALRRRGFPAQAIKNFCKKIGVTEATDTILEPQMLEACVREVLNATSTRGMAVLEPLRVEIDNFPASSGPTLSVANIPAAVCETEGVKPTGDHKVDVCSTVYISQEDFSEAPPKGYKRLTVGGTVGLMHLGLIFTLKDVVKAADGSVSKLVGSVANVDPKNKPKGWIQWVSSSSPEVLPQTAEVRVYSRLFKSPNPESNSAGLLADAEEQSLVVHKGAMVDKAVKGSKVGDVFQFERSGYYCVDKDSSPSTPIFNLTIGLKGEAKKK